MEATLTLPAPAKLNLFLHITGRYPNGFHELQTVFQILDRGDLLHFERLPGADISLAGDTLDVAPEENLIYKAAQALLPYQKSELGARITLQKNLPLGGGLGGGSSDAATTLLALNRLWQLKLSTDELRRIGLELGADVPVFIAGQSAWAEGVGEQLYPIELPGSWYLILCPDCHVSTPEIFSDQRLTRDTPKMKIAPALEAADLENFHNDCEAVARAHHPEIGKALDWLSRFGKGRLTGTGACCFCRFDDEASAKQVLNEARPEFKGFIARGVNLSPAHHRLNEAD